MYTLFYFLSYNERGNYMKFQWNLLLGLLFAIIIAIFAVFNVDAVQVNYMFRQSTVATCSCYFMCSSSWSDGQWVCRDVPVRSVKSSH